MKYVTLVLGIFCIAQPVFADTLTVYPSLDGTVSRGAAAADWTTLNTSAGTAANTTLATFNIEADAGNTSNTWITLIREIILFDTSALNSAHVAAITAVTFSLYATGKFDGLAATPSVDIYTSSPTSNTALVAADYQQVGTISQTGAALAYASITTNAYNDFAFNATGIGNIAMNGISKFSVRNANYDVPIVAPPWVIFSNYSIAFSSSRAAGTTHDPKLVITYTTFPSAKALFQQGKSLFRSGKLLLP
jgi:hypothetical protein